MHIESFLIRRSPAILVYRIAWMTMFFYAITTVLYLLFSQMSDTFGFVSFLENRILSLLFTLIIELCLIVFLFIQWSMTTYEIRPGELVYRSGFIRRAIDIHSLKNMQTVYVSQGVFGRIFGFGTVRLYNPMSKEELRLEHISDPERYAESMRQVLDVPAHTTILRPPRSV